MSTDIKDIPLRFAGLRRSASIPAWAKRWHAERTTVDELFRFSRPPGVVVIQSPDHAMFETFLKEMNRDADKFAIIMEGMHMVVQFGATMEPEVTDVARMLRLFPNPVGRVEFTWGQDRLKQSIIEAVAKLMVEQEERNAQRPGPLAEIKEVIEATRPLLARSGRLSATAIAEAFDLSTAKLGQIIGSSRQALAKTPDAPAIQTALRPFERIARLRAQLSDKHFRAWLHRPNRLLGEATPLSLITDGRVGVVADLAEDMLLGTPG